MVSIQLICVGKLKERFYQDAAAEYQKRLGAFCRLSILELPEFRLPDRPSPAQVEAALSREAVQILDKLPKGGIVIALCVEGLTISSEALAQELERRMVSGASQITFVIGGSYGLHPSVKQSAQLQLSMSPMTFPHHLARIMLLEQIYRSFQIRQGSSYHK